MRRSITLVVVCAVLLLGAAPAGAAGVAPTRAVVPDLDAIRQSRLRKCTLFEMDSTPEIDAVQTEYMRLANALWEGSDPMAPEPLEDREIFDLLGFD